MPLPATLAALRHAADAGVSVVLDAERCAEIVRAVTLESDGGWVGIREAAAALNMPIGTVRSRAPRWAMLTAQDRRPAVRTRKKNPDNLASHYEFYLSDCRRNRRADVGTEQPEERRVKHLRVEDGGAKPLTGDARERTIQHYVEWARSLDEGA